MRGGKTVVGLLAILTIGACAAVAAITAIHLNNVSVSLGSDVSASMDQCVLGTTDTVTNTCLYAYIAAGVGAALALIMVLVACITCKCCGWGHIFDFIIGIIGTAWMAAFGVLFLILANQEQNKDLPNSSWRFAVWLCCFIAAALFFIMTILSGVLMCAACCGRKKEKPIAGDLEASSGKVATPAYQSDTGAGVSDQYRAPQYNTASDQYATTNTTNQYPTVAPATQQYA